MDSEEKQVDYFIVRSIFNSLMIIKNGIFTHMEVSH